MVLDKELEELKAELHKAAKHIEAAQVIVGNHSESYLEDLLSIAWSNIYQARKEIRDID